jgi:hypothetical protein
MHSRPCDFILRGRSYSSVNCSALILFQPFSDCVISIRFRLSSLELQHQDCPQIEFHIFSMQTQFGESILSGLSDYLQYNYRSFPLLVSR